MRLASPLAPRTAIFVAAFVLTLSLGGAPPLTAEAGYFTVTYPEITLVRELIHDDGERTLIVNAPSTKMATTSGVSWPAQAPSVPTFLQVFKITWTPLAQPDTVTSSASSCSQQALLAQAKPEKYELSIWIYVPDASLSEEALPNRFQVWLTEGYRIGCALRKR